jgi:hypothetical protein
LATCMNMETGCMLRNRRLYQQQPLTPKSYPGCRNRPGLRRGQGFRAAPNRLSGRAVPVTSALPRTSIFLLPNQ